MARRFDRQAATAQARTVRIEDQAHRSRRVADEAASDADGQGLSQSDRDLLHIATEDEPISDEVVEHVNIEGDAMVDALAEAFNARDLETVVDLCATDCEIPGLASDLAEVGPALDDLWLRRPSIAMTRVELDGRAVGVVWERLGASVWGEVGTVHVVLDGLQDQIEVLEFSDDVALLDRRHSEPPDVHDPMWNDPDEVVDA